MPNDDQERGRGHRPDPKPTSPGAPPTGRKDDRQRPPPRAEKPDRDDRPDRPGHPGRPDEPDRPDKPDRPDEPDREQEWPDPEGPRPEKLLEEYPTGRIPGHRGKERYTPFIVMRYAAGDGGARPLPPGSTFWHSPDVWVESSAGYNVPVAAEANTIRARVNNRGMKDASGVVVRYWWANPSLAITEASAHQIGMATGVFVPSGNSVVVTCPTPWVPVVENDGHECVFAEAWAPYWDPIVAPLEPVTDRHVCQKNLHLVEAAPGAQIAFPIQMANISPIRQRVVVHTRALSFREMRTALTAPDVGYRERLLESRQGLPMKLELSAEGEFLASPTSVYPLRLLSATRGTGTPGAQECQPSGALTRTADMKAWESRTLTLHARIPPDARQHQVFGYDIQQRMGEVVTGGYTLYIVVDQ